VETRADASRALHILPRFLDVIGTVRNETLQAERLRRGNFFDVPVYRLPSERYYNERDAYIDRMIFRPNDKSSPWLREYYKVHRDDYIRFHDHLVHRYGGPWNYNEIVGYIRLHFMGSQIRGEYFSVERKRIVRTRTKIFAHRTHKLAPEISIPAGAGNDDIFRLIKEYLKDCQREVPRRCIDTELLDVIGPYVDWTVDRPARILRRIVRRPLPDPDQ